MFTPRWDYSYHHFSHSTEAGQGSRLRLESPLAHNLAPGPAPPVWERDTESKRTCFSNNRPKEGAVTLAPKFGGHLPLSLVPYQARINSGCPMKKCETIGCSNAGVQMFQVAPATNVWLCRNCIERVEKENAAATAP